MRLALLLFPVVMLAASDAALVRTGALPNPVQTPGDTLDVTVADICITGYTKKVRNVPAAVKRQVYAAYDRAPLKGVCCEVDHLIPLELGGSNRVRNLWPEPYDIEWNAHVKDRIEGRLHKLVCAGNLDLATAQAIIARNWIEAYQEYGARRSSERSAKRRRRE